MQNEIDKVPYKSLLPDNKDLKKRNAAFDALTDAQKRQEIAYDALGLIFSRQVGCDIHGYWDEKLLNIPSDSPQEFQEKLVFELPERCEVCERGLLMLSQIRLGNKVSPRDGYRSEGNDNNLQGFRLDSFIYMEAEYEKDRYCGPYPRHTIEKMVNICCNVIANGDFDRYDKKDYIKDWNIVTTTLY